MPKTPNQSSTGKTKAASDLAGKSKSAAAAKQSKSATDIVLLRQKGGAILDEMMSATGWQKDSLRGFLAGALKKQHGLIATSDKTGDGRVYRLAADAQQ